MRARAWADLPAAADAADLEAPAIREEDNEDKEAAKADSDWVHYPVIPAARWRHRQN